MNNIQVVEGRKEWRNVVLVMLPIVALFYLLNCCNIFTVDDPSYQFICQIDCWVWEIPNPIKIDSYCDVLLSQYNHYFRYNGRSIVHALEQCAVALWGRSIFNVLNTLLFVIFSYLSIALIDRSLLKNYMAWGITAIIVTFVLPAHSSFYYSAALAFNYLWALTFCLLFVYIWMYYQNHKWVHTIFLAIICFFAGWSHELFALPISGAICVYYLVHRKEMISHRCLLSCAFCCGALVLIIAPGNWSKMGGGGYDILYQIYNILSYLFSKVQTIILLLIVSIVLVYKLKFDLICSILRTRFFYVLIFLFSLVLGFIFPLNGARVFIGIGYWWIVLIIIILLKTLKYKSCYKYIFGVLYALMLASVIIVCYYCNIMSCSYREVEDRYVNTESGLVFMDEPEIPHMVRSSLFPINKWAIESTYPWLNRKLLLFDKSFESTINNSEDLFCEKNRISGNAGFYHVNHDSNLLLINHIDSLDREFIITFSGREPVFGLEKYVKLLKPNLYMQSTQSITSDAITYITYNGVELGFLKMWERSGRRLVAIDVVE